MALTTNCIAFAGDSITQTTPGRAPTPIPQLLERSLGPKYSVGQYGISGQQTSGFATQYTASISGKGFTKMCVLIGVNDIINTADSAATIYARLLNGATGPIDVALAAGIKVTWSTVLPFGTYASWTSGMQTRLEALNALISAASHANLRVIDGYTYMADVVDTDGLAYLGGTKPDCQTFSDNTRDGLHLGPLGVTRLATYFYDNLL